MKCVALVSIIICGGLWIGCHSGGATPYSSQDKGVALAPGSSEPMGVNSARGEEIFQEKCQGCHGIAGSAHINGAANLQISRIDSISITQVIKNGRGVMPMFKDAMPDSDIGHLAVYVKSIRKY